jgi:hypothetical protein
MSANIVFVLNSTIGSGGGLLARLGVIAVYFIALRGIYKIYKAKKRHGETRPWQVAGIILFCGALIFALACNAIAENAARRRFSAIFSHNSGAAGRILRERFACEEQRIKGRSSEYSLLRPSGWEVASIDIEGVDLCLNAIDRPLVVAVIILENDGTAGLRQYAERIRDTYLPSHPGTEATEIEIVTIDECEWAGYIIKPAPGGTRLMYQYYIYNDATQAYLLAGWTTDNVFDAYAPTLRKLMQTFQFPKTTSEK